MTLMIVFPFKKDESKRQNFQIDFQRFSKQMDIVLPDAAARAHISDLGKLGKISHGARNLYRDEQLFVVDAGNKVRRLIEDHISSTEVNLAIPPVDLMDPDFKEKLNYKKALKPKAAES